MRTKAPQRHRNTPAPVIAVGVAVSVLAGCATIRGPRQIAGRAEGTGLESDWSRIGEVAAATGIVVTRRGAAPEPRYFIRTDGAAVTLLNLTTPAQPTNVIRGLRDLAAMHPEYFGTVQNGSIRQGDVTVGRDGVLVANRKVADLDQVVQTIARNDVIEIDGPVVARGSVIGTIIGAWLGFSIGAVPALGGASSGAAWSALVGSMAGGAYLGFHWSSHRTDGVIYRAP